MVPVLRVWLQALLYSIEQLEQRLAAFKGCEQALLFSSGYHANMGVISSLVGPRDVILGDEFNHASIIDGSRVASAARPTGAEYKTYPHCDIVSLHNNWKSWIGQAIVAYG